MKMKKSILGVIVISAALSGIFLFQSVSFAQEKVLKLAHQWIQGDIRDKWASNFCSLAEKYSQGTVKCRIYPGGTLMNPQTQIDALRQGALDLCIWHPGYSAGKEPLLGILDLAGVVPYPEKGSRLVRTEVGKRITEKAEKLGMKILAWGFMPNAIGSKKGPINLPKDMRGHKMRGGSKAIEEIFRSAGAAITHVSTGEIYMALQTGVLDSVLSSEATFLALRLFEVLKYMTIAGQHSIAHASVVLAISPVTFKKLTPDQQKAVIRAGQESEATFMADIKAVSVEVRKAYVDNGVKVSELTDEELRAWVTLAKEKSWKPFMKEVKGSSELFDIIEKTN